MIVPKDETGSAQPLMSFWTISGHRVAVTQILADLTFENMILI
jgi:hypothetical protein